MYFSNQDIVDMQAREAAEDLAVAEYKAQRDAAQANTTPWVTVQPWNWTNTAVSELRIGDVVQDAYANPAIVVETGTRHAVTIMQLVGSDQGHFCGLPLYIYRLDTPEIAEQMREKGRRVWCQKFAR